LDFELIEASAWEEGHEPCDSTLDHVDAGRFKRLQEAACETERDDILDPRLLAVARLETKGPRIRERRSVQIGKQHVRGFFVADMCARINISIAGAVLQRDAPLPPRGLSGRAGEGLLVVAALAGDGHCTVAR